MLCCIFSFTHNSVASNRCHDTYVTKFFLLTDEDGVNVGGAIAGGVVAGGVVVGGVVVIVVAVICIRKQSRKVKKVTYC